MRLSVDEVRRPGRNHPDQLDTQTRVWTTPPFTDEGYVVSLIA